MENNVVLQKTYYLQLQQLFDENHDNQSFDLSLVRTPTQQNIQTIRAFDNRREIIYHVFTTVQRLCIRDLILYLQKLIRNSMYQMVIQILATIYDHQNSDVYIMLVYQINECILQR